MTDVSDEKSVPVSVLIPTRNEEANLPRCLDAVAGWADEVLVVDSQSTDGTIEIAGDYGAEVIQFEYDGGWPKKRQWALDTYDFDNEWILLLDADEILLPPIKSEIAEAIQTDAYDGYWLRFQLHFLGRPLRHGGFDLWKLYLFRHGTGRYERRFEGQDESMSDIEIHEHVVVDGEVGRLQHPVRHENWNSLYRYIEKHNEYSEWEARLYHEGDSGAVEPDLFGNQAQRRRWLKDLLVRVPGFPLITFLYHYVLRLGFLDGKPGFIYCVLKGVQRFHAKAKWYELELRE
ncbi:glycosyltransferase family 2 protein [Salinibacter ruber]|uniref:glycosyltransferase family 2 protein n=1 Tax=Salinibacter ruber TaxID=146919 RepID=UPI000E598909|nr:glycosyltransferase family 2 protein [Salinibacter ruber]